MADKRIYQLNTAVDLTAQYLALDKSGNAEAEKVLATDLGSTAENGLTKTGGVIRLGGALTQDTVIDGGAGTYQYSLGDLLYSKINTINLGVDSEIVMDDIGIKNLVTEGDVTAAMNVTKNAVNFNYHDDITGGTSAMIANDTFGFLLNENGSNDLARLTMQGGVQAYLYHEMNTGELSYLDLTDFHAYLSAADAGASVAELYLGNPGEVSIYAYDAGADNEFYLDYFGGEIYLEAYDNGSGSSGGLYISTVGGDLELYVSDSTLTLGQSGNKLFDSDNNKGLEYGADYSANYTARSLIDKGYADATYGGGSYTFQNGLFEFPAGTVGLGGNLTGDTSIDGSNTHNFSILNIGSILELRTDAGGTTQHQLLLQDGVGSFLQSLDGAGGTRSYFGVDGSNASMAVAPLTPGPPLMSIILQYPSQMIVTDLVNTKGLVYAADYSANYSARSIVDKAYVDATAATGGLSLGAVDQIPVTNAATDDFDYTSSFTFTGSLFTANANWFAQQLGDMTVTLRTTSGANDVKVAFQQVATTKCLIGWDDAENAFSMQHGTDFSSWGNFRIELGAIAGFYGVSSAQFVIRGQTGGVQLFMAPNAGSDAQIFWQDGFGSTQFVEGHDSSQSLFQIHSGSSFTTPELADFSINTSGRIYMGSLLNATETNTLRYNLSTGQVTFFSSDISLKDKIKPFEVDALEILQQFDPKVWKWKEDGTDGTGWIAQEGVRYIPKMFPKSGKTGLHGISEYEILPYYHKAIQQLQGKIDELESKLKFIDT